MRQAVEAEQQTASEAREQYASSERRAMVLAGEIEELRTQLEAAERARKGAENELHEASDRVGDLSNANSSLATQKRKLENDIQAMQVIQRSFSSRKRWSMFYRRWFVCLTVTTITKKIVDRFVRNL